MKASELRIGNLINVPNSIVERSVNQLYANPKKECFVNGAPISHYTPIPLTEDWLKRFGFVKELGIDICWTKVLGYYAPMKMVTRSISLWQKEDNKIVFVGNHNPPVVLQSVHQLQNLYFALTGEELTLSA